MLWAVFIFPSVFQRLFYLKVFRDKLKGLGIKIRLGKLFPNILHSLRAWVQHVLLVEAVIAQVVHHDFVDGQVGTLWVFLCGLVHGTEQFCLA